MQSPLTKSRLAFLKCPVTWLKGGYCFVMTFLCVAVFQTQVHFLISETDSQPAHYFLAFPKIRPQLNDYTVVYSPWLQQKIVKKIIGVAGDFIWFNQQWECFVDENRVGSFERVASDGRPLTPIESQTIPEGRVFLYGPHSRSFDSRYQELGLVRSSDLQGKVIPLW